MTIETATLLSQEVDFDSKIKHAHQCPDDLGKNHPTKRLGFLRNSSLTVQIIFFIVKRSDFCALTLGSFSIKLGKERL